MADIYHIFFSCRRHDFPRARPLLEALTSAGLRVFADETAIDEAASITREIRERRSASQSSWWLSFQAPTPQVVLVRRRLFRPGWQPKTAKELPQHRIRIVNLEPAFDHIPASLRDFKAHALPNEHAAMAELVNAIRAHIESLDEPVLDDAIVW